MDASVTFWEATAPVKLPTRHGPLAYPGLEPETEKSGISTAAPLRLASELPSLPPILHISDPSPVSSCSKAPRGLFVLSRGARIFTGNAISPSPSLRQCPGRYAIRAGRNLPDKGLRYLRTVIVTAAVHRGFSRQLSPPSLTYRHWAGVSPYTSPFGLARTCVFDKQSLEPILCGHQRFSEQVLIRQRPPFFRSYGVNLPSSLTMVVSHALGHLSLSTSVGLRYGRLKFSLTGLF